MWNELLDPKTQGKKPLDKKSIGNLLKGIKLMLPSGPSNYCDAFSGLHWPVKKGKIYFEKNAKITISTGVAIIESGVSVRAKCRDFPNMIGKKVIVRVPFDPTKRRHHNIVLCEGYQQKDQLADWYAYGVCSFSEELDRMVLTVRHPAHLVISKVYNHPA